MFFVFFELSLDHCLKFPIIFCLSVHVGGLGLVGN